MRQLIVIASLVGLLMYTGFVIQENEPAAAGIARAAGVAPLESALRATGATLEKVTIVAWAPTSEPRVTDRLAAALGWGGPGTAGQDQVVKTYTQGGTTHVQVRWVMIGARAAAWQDGEAAVRRAFASLGANATVTVQLEGLTEQVDLTALQEKALDTVGATERQPWAGPMAASSAGRSTQLPASSLGVNVQVALRLDPSGKRAKVWVAWPALQQEY